MFKLGITGGMGSGKSTASQFFKDKGVDSMSMRFAHLKTQDICDLIQNEYPKIWKTC